MQENTGISAENLAPRKPDRILADVGEYLSVVEFCEYFSLSPQTVARWLRNGELPGLRIGKLWRISKVTVARIEAGELKLGPKDSEGDSDEGSE